MILITKDLFDKIHTSKYETAFDVTYESWSKTNCINRHSTSYRVDNCTTYRCNAYYLNYTHIRSNTFGHDS